LDKEKRTTRRIIEFKENLPNISNPQQARTKGAAPKKRIKNALKILLTGITNN